MALRIDSTNTLDIVLTPGNTRQGVVYPIKNSLYVASENAYEIYEIDIPTYTLVNTIVTSERPVKGIYNSNNQHIYFSASNNRIYKISAANVVTEILLPEEERADRGAYSPEDNLIYYLSDSVNKVYVINATDTVSAITLSAFPRGIFYNQVDGKIYVGTETGYLILSNGTIEQQSNPGNQLSFPGLDPIRNRVFFRSDLPDGVYFVGKSPVSISNNLSIINQEISSGSFRIDCLKIISTDIEQFGLPITNIQKTLTGRSQEESIFPADYFGSFFSNNVVQLTGEELNHFVVSENNYIRMTVKASSTLSLLFSGKLVKPSDTLVKKLRRLPAEIEEEYELIEVERNIPEQKPSDFKIEVNNTGITEIDIIFFSHYYTQDPIITQYINTVQGWDEVNREVNSGAFRITQLKIMTSDITQFSNPLLVTYTSLTDRETTEPEFPIDLFSKDHYQNVVVLDEKDLNDYTASVHNYMKVRIQPGTQVSFSFTGELYKAGDILKNKKKLDYYE